MSKIIINKRQRENRRHNRVRAKISGTAKRPRMCVTRSLMTTYVQLIDDTSSKTLVSGNTKGLKGSKTEVAVLLGKKIAEDAQKAGIESVVFDRGSSRYQGRVKALAESAREVGLKF